RFSGVQARLRREPAVAKQPLPRQRPLGVVQLGTADLNVRLGLGQLGPDVRVLDAGDHVPRPYSIALNDAEVDEPARALGRDGGLLRFHDRTILTPRATRRRTLPSPTRQRCSSCVTSSRMVYGPWDSLGLTPRRVREAGSPAPGRVSRPACLAPRLRAKRRRA